MKRLCFSMALFCLSSMVFAVTYPSRPYKSTSVYNLQAELEVPMLHLNHTSARAVQCRSVSVRAVSQNSSFALTMQASSNSTLHSYISGSTISGGNASVGRANVSMSAFPASKSILSSSIPDPAVRQLACTTHDPPEIIALRAEKPSTEGDDPDNPDLWIPVGNGMTTLLLLLIAYVLIIKRKRRAVTLR